MRRRQTKENFCVISMTLLPSEALRAWKKYIRKACERGWDARPAHWAFYFNIKLFEPDVVVGCCVAPFSSSPRNREKVFICCYCVGALVMLLVTSQWQWMKKWNECKSFRCDWYMMITRKKIKSSKKNILLGNFVWRILW